MSTIEVTTLPPDTLASALGFRGYVDAYRVRLDREVFPDVDTFARALFRRPPRWTRWLLGVRDAIVRPFGLKEAGGREGVRGPLDLSMGARVGIFRVIDRSEREVVFGEDDRHLDFRVSLIHLDDADGCAAIVATLVRFHNVFGRVYFWPVAPFHRFVVTSMMRKAVARARTQAG